MKRLCLLILVALLLFGVSCKQWSDEKGHIYRHDIEPGDFAFLFDAWDYEPGMIYRAPLKTLRKACANTENMV